MRRRYMYAYTVANAVEPGGGLLSKRDAVVGARFRREQAKCDTWVWRKEIREGAEWNVCKVFKWSVVEREHGEEPKKQETLNMGQSSYDCEIMSRVLQGMVVLTRACCYDCHEAGFAVVAAKIVEIEERKTAVTLRLCCTEARQLKVLQNKEVSFVKARRSNEEVWKRIEALRVEGQK